MGLAFEGEVGLGLLEGVGLRSKMVCSGGEMGDVVGCSEQVEMREASVLFLMLQKAFGVPTLVWRQWKSVLVAL